MRYETALRLLAPVFPAVSALHLGLGLKADRMLGADVPDAAVDDPGLDSQNRFYGVSFSLAGVLLLLVASDVPRYRPVLRAILASVFAGGLGRLVSIKAKGRPSVPILGLLAVELAVPPALGVWLRRAPGRPRARRCGCGVSRLTGQVPMPLAGRGGSPNRR